MKVYEKINKIKEINTSAKEMVEWAYLNKISSYDIFTELNIKPTRELERALEETYSEDWMEHIENFFYAELLEPSPAKGIHNCIGCSFSFSGYCQRYKKWAYLVTKKECSK